MCFSTRAGYLILLSLVFAIAIALSSTGASEDTQRLLQRADSLIQRKHYHSAFRLLDEADKESENPDIVLKKVDIALNFFVLSFHHRIFAFKDLDMEEKIEEVRGKAGSYEVYLFPIDSVLVKLIQTYPSDWRLHRGLGDLYYEVYLNYEEGYRDYGDSLEPVYDQPLAKAGEYYREAYQNGEYDYLSLERLGILQLKEADYDGAIRFFLESIQLNDAYPSSWYNAAYAYLYKDQRDEALKYATQALRLYEDYELRADAARMIAVIYGELGDDINSLKYYELANEIHPRNYYSLQPLLELYLKKRDVTSAQSTADSLFSLDPTNPQLPSDILNAYVGYGFEQELGEFFARTEKHFAENHEAMGNLLFYKGQWFLWQENDDQARDCFSQARSHFQQCFNADHEVFQVIEEMLKSLE